MLQKGERNLFQTSGKKICQAGKVSPCQPSVLPSHTDLSNRGYTGQSLETPGNPFAFLLGHDYRLNLISRRTS